MSDFVGGGGGGYVRQFLETVNRSENIWEEETHQAQIPGKLG